MESPQEGRLAKGLQNRFYMSMSVFLRMGVGLVVVVLLARDLGPVSYGVVTTAIAYATLASLLTDFGLISRTLRDIAAEPHNGVRLLNDSLSVKFYLTGAVSVIGVICIVPLHIPADVRASSVLIGLAVLLAAIGDHTCTAYRATGRFRLEAWLTTWTSAVHIGLLGTVVLLHLKLLAVAVAFLISRFVYMLVILRGARRLFPDYKFQTLDLRASWLMMRDAWGWAADSGFGYVNGQIDGLVVAPLFGLHAAGIYQSGARFVQASLALVVILANVHIPKLAAVERSGPWTVLKGEVKMIIEFTATGSGLAAFLWLGGPMISTYFLGAKFKAVDELWPGFAVFVLLRFMAGSLGAVLTSGNVPLCRVGGQAIGLLTVIIGLCFLRSGGQLTMLPWVMASGALAVLLTYAGIRIALIFAPRAAL